MPSGDTKEMPELEHEEIKLSMSAIMNINLLATNFRSLAKAGISTNLTRISAKG